MVKYKFPAAEVTGVLSHIVAYDATILSMTPEGGLYIVEIDVQLPHEEYLHLNESYGFEEVV